MQSENSTNGRKFIGTYDSLGSATALSAVVLEKVENLGTRHYAIVVLAKNLDHVFSR